MQSTGCVSSLLGRGWEGTRPAYLRTVQRLAGTSSAPFCAAFPAVCEIDCTASRTEARLACAFMSLLLSGGGTTLHYLRPVPWTVRDRKAMRFDGANFIPTKRLGEN